MCERADRAGRHRFRGDHLRRRNGIACAWRTLPCRSHVAACPARTAALEAAPPPAPAAPPGTVTSLSNLRTLSRWAYPNAVTVARSVALAHRAGDRSAATADDRQAGRAVSRARARRSPPPAKRGSRSTCRGAPTVTPAGCRAARWVRFTRSTATCRVDRRRLRVTLFRRGRGGLQRADRRRQGEHENTCGQLLRDGEAAGDQRTRSTARSRSAPAPMRRRSANGPAAAWSASTAPTNRS